MTSCRLRPEPCWPSSSWLRSHLRRNQWLCENVSIWEKLKALPVTLWPSSGEHLSEEYKKNVNRFGKVPAIVDGDFKLSESPAILRYVLEKHPVEDFWYPENVKERARVDEYLSWAHNNIRMVIAMSFFSKFRDPILFGQKPDPENVSNLLKKQRNQCNSYSASTVKEAGQERAEGTGWVREPVDRNRLHIREQVYRRWYFRILRFGTSK